MRETELSLYGPSETFQGVFKVLITWGKNLQTSRHFLASIKYVTVVTMTPRRCLFTAPIEVFAPREAQALETSRPVPQAHSAPCWLSKLLHLFP